MHRAACTHASANVGLQEDLKIKRRHVRVINTTMWELGLYVTKGGTRTRVTRDSNRSHNFSSPLQDRITLETRKLATLLFTCTDFRTRSSERCVPAVCVHGWSLTPGQALLSFLDKCKRF